MYEQKARGRGKHKSFIKISNIKSNLIRFKAIIHEQNETITNK